jgi:hypothetical protein
MSGGEAQIRRSDREVLDPEVVRNVGEDERWHGVLALERWRSESQCPMEGPA